MKQNAIPSNVGLRLQAQNSTLGGMTQLRSMTNLSNLLSWGAMPTIATHHA